MKAPFKLGKVISKPDLGKNIKFVALILPDTTESVLTQFTF